MEPNSGQAPASPGALPTAAGAADGVKKPSGAAEAKKKQLPEIKVLAEDLYSEDSALVGLRVKTFWEKEQQWFAGVVTADPDLAHYPALRITYEDDDCEDVLFKKNFTQIVSQEPGTKGAASSIKWLHKQPVWAAGDDTPKAEAVGFELLPKLRALEEKRQQQRQQHLQQQQQQQHKAKRKRGAGDGSSSSSSEVGSKALEMCNIIGPQKVVRAVLEQMARLPLGPGRVNLLYLVDSTLKQASKVPASQQSQHIADLPAKVSAGLTSMVSSAVYDLESLRKVRHLLDLWCQQGRVVASMAKLAYHAMSSFERQAAAQLKAAADAAASGVPEGLQAQRVVLQAYEWLDDQQQQQQLDGQQVAAADADAAEPPKQPQQQGAAGVVPAAAVASRDPRSQQQQQQQQAGSAPDSPSLSELLLTALNAEVEADADAATSHPKQQQEQQQQQLVCNLFGPSVVHGYILDQYGSVSGLTQPPFAAAVAKLKGRQQQQQHLALGGLFGQLRQRRLVLQLAPDILADQEVDWVEIVQEVGSRVSTWKQLLGPIDDAKEAEAAAAGSDNAAAQQQQQQQQGEEGAGLTEEDRTWSEWSAAADKQQQQQQGGDAAAEVDGTGSDGYNSPTSGWVCPAAPKRQAEGPGYTGGFANGGAMGLGSGAGEWEDPAAAAAAAAAAGSGAKQSEQQQQQQQAPRRFVVPGGLDDDDDEDDDDQDPLDAFMSAAAGGGRVSFMAADDDDDFAPPLPVGPPPAEPASPEQPPLPPDETSPLYNPDEDDGGIMPPLPPDNRSPPPPLPPDEDSYGGVDMDLEGGLGGGSAVGFGGAGMAAAWQQQQQQMMMVAQQQAAMGMGMRAGMGAGAAVYGAAAVGGAAAGGCYGAGGMQQQQYLQQQQQQMLMQQQMMAQQQQQQMVPGAQGYWPQQQQLQQQPGAMVPGMQQQQQQYLGSMYGQQQYPQM
ncbi:hypothetical protein OEZ86_008768 [Tetradesmus obliquus]|nr:hypothetical protein OEZ86_008768 [Tetradesmus obliquus]